MEAIAIHYGLMSSPTNAPVSNSNDAQSMELQRMMQQMNMGDSVNR